MFRRAARLQTFPERIAIEKADEVTILVAAATGYGGVQPKQVVERRLDAAAAKPFDTLARDHVSDHQRLFRRASLRLGTAEERSALPTDERLERVKHGESDLDLEALYFQFGRYLLIASSRPGDLPANLQGLWNDSMSPPWDSDYHLNINLQMNYWPAEVTNLAETHEPLFDFLDSLRAAGRKTARVHYGAGDSSPITSLTSGASRRPAICHVRVCGRPALPGSRSTCGSTTCSSPIARSSPRSIRYSRKLPSSFSTTLCRMRKDGS